MSDREKDQKLLLDAQVQAYRAVQNDLSKFINTRTQLMSQAQENDMVMEELKRSGDDANVFKMIGPVLVKQDLVEAKSNVSKRIEYIKGEVDRVESQIKSLEAKAKDKEQEVMRLSKKFQSQAQVAQ
eukprot:gene16002-22138_t